MFLSVFHINSQADNANASHLLALLFFVLEFSFSMNHSAHWIDNYAKRCNQNSSASNAKQESPSYLSHMIKKKRCA